MKSRGLVLLELYGFAVATMLMLPPMLWPGSTIARVVMYAACAFVLGSLLLKARAGYRRRLPHWTPESWRRFFTVCGMFAGVLALSICMMIAVEMKLPVTGGPRTTTRSIWAAALMGLMVIGTLGLTSGVFWLSEGDASAQFTKFQKRARA